MIQAIKPFAWYILAALGEIGGCFAFWAWLRQQQSPLWVLPGLLALAGFATVLTRIDEIYAGRAFAAYGGIYILTALVWLILVERARPDRWDILGAAVCVLGSAIILFGPRSK